MTNTHLKADSKINCNLLSRHIEVLLHISEMPLTKNDLQKRLSGQYLVDVNDITTALLLLEERLSGGVLELSQTASGYRLQIKAEYAPLIQQIFPERPETLSQAVLETLSIIAYKQPVTRLDIEQIRGVSVSSHILRQLFDKGWIVEKGYKDTLGRPALLHTTDEFLDAFGLCSLAELPPMPDINALSINTNPS